jgi:lipopolysaccharide transport system permease protein
VTQAPVIIESTRGRVRLDLRTLWHYRDLLYLMVWREIRVRYKQTAIGAGWAVFQPLMTMVVFSIIFGRFAKLPSDGVPYPVFALAALLPWTYFNQAITRGGIGLVTHANLLTKVYFPRLIIPLAAVLAPMIDFLIAFVILVVFMLWYGIAPTWGVVVLPVFVMVAMLTALGTSLWLAPMNVRYRDVGQAIPLLMQLWMYGSPVAYSVSMIPEKWRPLYSLNPMVGVIEGFRWALLGKQSPDFAVITLSAAAVVVFVFGGIVYFKTMERTFADVV